MIHYSLFATALLLLSSTWAQAQFKHEKVAIVAIAGSGAQAKTKIESAGSSKKVARVVWDESAQAAALLFDSTKTSREEILKRIALAGYDNTAFMAPNPLKRVAASQEPGGTGREMMDHAGMDHAGMDHGRGTPDAGPTRKDHAEMEAGRGIPDAGSGTKDLATMDLATMDLATMDLATMDHATMDHATMDLATMDHATMDHATMDHATMDHAKGEQSTPTSAAVSTPAPAPKPTPKPTTSPAKSASAPKPPTPAKSASAQPANLEAVFTYYFQLKDALVASDLAKATGTANNLGKAVDAVDMAKLPSDVHSAWMKAVAPLKADVKAISTAKNIDAQRKTFKSLSTRLVQLAKVADPAGTVYVQRCPMYEGGSDWLSKDSTIKNPYYGAQMLSCGSTVETLK